MYNRTDSPRMNCLQRVTHQNIEGPPTETLPFVQDKTYANKWGWCLEGPPITDTHQFIQDELCTDGFSAPGGIPDFWCTNYSSRTNLAQKSVCQLKKSVLVMESQVELYGSGDHRLPMHTRPPTQIVHDDLSALTKNRGCTVFVHDEMCTPGRGRGSTKFILDKLCVPRRGERRTTFVVDKTRVSRVATDRQQRRKIQWNYPEHTSTVLDEIISTWRAPACTSFRPRQTVYMQKILLPGEP